MGNHCVTRKARAVYIYIYCRGEVRTMLSFLHAVHDVKMRRSMEQSAIPLMQRVRMRQKVQKAAKSEANDLQGRGHDIQQFLKELYSIEGKSSMHLHSVVKQMQCLSFIYTAQQAERLLRLFAQTSDRYEMNSMHGRDYIRGANTICSAYLSGPDHSSKKFLCAVKSHDRIMKKG